MGCQKIMQNTDTKYQIIRNAQIRKAKAKDESMRKGERKTLNVFQTTVFKYTKEKLPQSY